MKRINFTTGILLIYLIVMCVIGWPGKQLEPNYIEYFSIMGISAAAIILLRYMQIRRLKMREKIKEEKKSE